MLILRIFHLALHSKKAFQATTGGTLVALSIYLFWLILHIRPQEIPCHSDQLIKHAEYSIHCAKGSTDTTKEYRDSEYDEYNSILLTGNSDVAHIIGKIHKTAQEMKNRTKGYDIKIGKCPSREMIKYFLVLEIEKTDEETVVYVKNRGWQANSDVFSIFCDRLPISDAKRKSVFGLIDIVFNKISLGVNEEGIEPVLGVLHNIHNLYSHSLGVYFYWMVEEKAIFLCSNVLLVLLIGVFLIFLEFITGGDFDIGIFRPANIPSFILLVCNAAFIDSICLSFFETFFIYCVLVPLHFPLALVLGGSRIIFFFCEIIGCSENRNTFVSHFTLLYEKSAPNKSKESFLPDSFSTRDKERK